MAHDIHNFRFGDIPYTSGLELDAGSSICLKRAGVGGKGREGSYTPRVKSEGCCGQEWW